MKLKHKCKHTQSGNINSARKAQAGTAKYAIQHTCNNSTIILLKILNYECK